MDTSITFSSIVSSLQTLVNTIALPFAIVIAGWKIVYLAIFPGMMGADPLNMMPEGYSLQWPHVWTRIKLQLSGFARGMAWIGGIWILFNFVIAVVAMMANALDGVL